MRKSTTKFLGILLALVMVIASFAACGKSAEETTQDDVATPAPVEEAAEEATATPEPTEAPKNLNGLSVEVANWWISDPPPEPSNQREEDTQAYREEIMSKYNFTIKEVNLGTWNEYQEIVVSSIMSGAPAADVFFMDQRFVAAPLQQGLLYPLNTLENFDFTEEKWNQTVKELMTVDGNVYGMASGRMEPRLGVFFNKRLFEEANLDPNLPYDLQAKGEWTWEKFEEICSKLTRDTNNDGTPDVYAMASFSVEFFRGAVFSNNAQFVGKDENGQFYNATGDANFLEALEWGISLYDKGYHMPRPEDSEWNWFTQPFIEGKVAMQCAEQYMVSTYKDMADDWGFVIFPKGPRGEMMTVFTENIVVMPAGIDKQLAEDIAFAYNLYTEPTPGYEDEDWKTNYYSLFRDSRAVDETLDLFYKPGHGVISYLPMIPGLDYGDVCYDLDARALTPAETVEKVQQLWQTFIDQANGKNQ